MILVHHLEDSRSQRLLWLLEALEVPYQVKRYQRVPSTGLAPEALKKVHPLGKSPVLQDEKTILAESGAIFEYLLYKYDTGFKLHPKPDSEIFPTYLFWLHFAEGSVMGPLITRLLHQKTLEKVPRLIKPVAKLIFTGIEKAYLAKTIGKAMEYTDKALAGRRYLLGDKISAADIIMSFPLEASCAESAKMGRYSNIQKFVKEIQTDGYYISAREKGGPYKY